LPSTLQFIENTLLTAKNHLQEARFSALTDIARRASQHAQFLKNIKLTNLQHKELKHDKKSARLISY
jgi:single-stranded DNA-specific DHH superfamily exonuclease